MVIVELSAANPDLSMAMRMRLCYVVYSRSQEPRPMPSATLTVRLSQEVKDQLAQLSQSTRRTRSFLAAEAISSYVAREIQIVEGIKRGLADMKAGRLVAHADAMTEIANLIEEAERGRG
ncbi:MAG: CopG family ribbon-helix-helix protein [Hyphomicrobiales bacterium]